MVGKRVRYVLLSRFDHGKLPSVSRGLTATGIAFSRGETRLKCAYMRRTGQYSRIGSDVPRGIGRITVSDVDRWSNRDIPQQKSTHGVVDLLPLVMPIWSL